jgi:hypothetical protein
MAVVVFARSCAGRSSLGGRARGLVSHQALELVNSSPFSPALPATFLSSSISNELHGEGEGEILIACSSKVVDFGYLRNQEATNATSRDGW